MAKKSARSRKRQQNQLKIIIAAVIVLLSLAVTVYIGQSLQNPNTVPGEISAYSEKLTWYPPPLANPTTVKITNSNRSPKLDVTKDYIVEMPSTPVTGPVAIVGGRNVVMKGGEISIPNQGDAPSIASRTALKIKNATGIVHVEGLLARGEDISEGIQIDAEDAIVQIQNVRIEHIHARDQVKFTDNHPDLIQTYGNVKELRVDKFSGSTDYQGFLLKADYNGAHGPVFIKRTNIVGDPTARYLFWAHPQEGFGNITLEEFYVDVPEQRWGGLGKAVWPDKDGSYPKQATIQTDDSGREYATFPAELQPRIIGRVKEGMPPLGDFVPAGSVGINYQSPGYGTSEADQPASPVPVSSTAPFSSPVPVQSPSPVPSPVSASSPVPVSSPTPVPTTPLIFLMEAEQMSGDGSVRVEASASNGSYRAFWSKGTAKGTIVTSAATKQLVVRAREHACRGPAKMTVMVDNKRVISGKAIDSRSWKEFVVPLSLSAGKHNVSVSFTNDYFRGCDRNLFIDVIKLK